ncbi:hypothetical protein KAR91_59910 [Candidatus Pacearchaeota archaeon]|nr:hypothetical protein [Candidatus Pacearchaeota archaeon]
MNDKCEAVKEVTVATNDLEKQTSMIEEKITFLKEKLIPVLCPAVNEIGVEPVNAISSVPLAQTIDGQVERLKNVTRSLDALLSSIEL